MHPIQRQLWKTLVLFALLGKISSIEIISVFSDNPETNVNSDNKYANKPYFLETFKVVEPLAEFHECSFINILECLSFYPNASILLDLSSDLDVHLSLSQVSKDHMLIHLVFNNDLKYSNKWTYSIAPSKSSQMDAFFSLLRYFNWTEGIVFGNGLSYELKTETNKFSSTLKFIPVGSDTNIDELVEKIVFRLGATLYYILTDPLQSAYLQDSLKNADLLNSGTGIILDQKSGYNCEYEGALIITEKGHEFDSNTTEYLAKSIIDVISYLLDNISSESLNELVSLFDFYLPNNNSIKNEFSIVNIQNGERIVVGSIINSNVTVIKDLVFPGKTKNPPKSAKKVLKLSINDGTTNPGFAPSEGSQIRSMGSYIAADKINEGTNILSNFQVSLYSFDCGVTIFNESFAKACFTKDADELGLAHFTGFGSAVAIGTLHLLPKLNMSIPCIGSTNMDPSLQSSASFPMYVRTIASSTYGQLISLISIMGWKKASIIYENNGWSITAYKLIVEMSKLLGIELINPINLHAIPPGLNETTILQYADVFQAIIISQARLLILLCQYPTSNYAAEYLYDLGMRKGDLVIYAGASDTLNYFLTNDTNLYKRFAVGYSAVQILYPVWAGEVGEDTKNRIFTKYHKQPAGASCSYYDSVYLVGNALDYMINRGQNYSDPIKLMKAIRSTKFIGCTGAVSIDNGSNDRIFDEFLIQAMKSNQDGNPIVYDVGEIKPYSAQRLFIIEPITYADGTTNKSSDLRNANYECPFPNDKVKTFVKGRAVLFVICFAVSLTTVIITFLIWKQWWNIPIEALKEKHEISLQDTIVGLTIAVEFFQFAAMGPDASIISPFLFNISNAMSLNLGNIFKMRNGIFWIVVNAIYGGIFLWVVFCVVVLFRLDEKWGFIWIFRFLGSAEDFIMPILGNLCFIPFVSICLDIFVCDHSIGENFTDSFLAFDCFYFCWKDEHLYYAIFSFIALIAYEPLAVFCRPL
ncbi:unnamed protein product [Blepharisma stoltei]|uniref:Receptor ligand binding region domain-containing protein n=1 Tax=Blepharisma stoltei TaxID=1481888 RepID=A0AAU9J0X9_9CILI|nr:unnamed protein product [Blepharisma stoltei]